MSVIDKIPSPCFVLEEEKLIRNLKLISDVRNRAGIEIILALKAYALWETFPLIGQYLNGATASSVNEALLINENMKCKAHTYAPAYSAADFEKLKTLSSHITFNSWTQFEQFRNKLSSDIAYGIRVNPEVRLAKTELYDPASPGSRLGVTADAMPEYLPKEISGMHVHVLCENGVAELKQVLNALEKNFEKYLHQIKWLNLGGGHLMTREGYDVEELVKTLIQFREKYQLQIIMEPGSAIAWETGFLKATVLDVVKNHGIQTALLNVSFTAHMPDCLEMPYKPGVRGEVEVETAKHIYRLGGSSCLAGDFIGDFGFNEPIKVNDTLLFEDMIHYTMVKTSMFNGVQHPSIGKIDLDGKFQLFRSFHYLDYRNRLG